MFARFVDLVETRARWVLVVWVLAAVAMTMSAPSLNDVGSQDITDFLPASAPSQQADQRLAELFPDDPTTDASVIVVARDAGLTPTDHAYLGELTTWLEGPDNADDVRAVQSASTNADLAAFLRASDGQAELVIVSFARAPCRSKAPTWSNGSATTWTPPPPPDSTTTSPASAASAPTRSKASSVPST